MKTTKTITNYDLIAHCKFMIITFTILAAQYDHDESDEIPTTDEKLQAEHCSGTAAAYRKIGRMIYKLSTSDDFSLDTEIIPDDFNQIKPQKITLNFNEKTLHNKDTFID